jgi:formylmethanofuran dehydrogenase subunit E-like metal-binding protein
MKFLGFLFLVVLAVGAWGYSQDWFEFSKSEAQGKTRYGVDVDENKITHDIDAVSKWARERLNDLDRQIDELRHKASKASPENKPAIEQEIRELEQKKGAASQELHELEKGTEAEQKESARKLQQTLREEEAKKGGGSL